MAQTKVIDLSNVNTIPENLRHARNAGVVGMIHKATEGTDTVDEKAEARVYLAQDAGMLIGLYHRIGQGSARSQARFFAKTAEELGLEDGWLLACYWDDPSVKPDKVAEFLTELEGVTDRLPKLYVNVATAATLSDDDRRLSQYPLWLGQHDSALDVPVAWGKFFLWQYTAQGDVPGVNPPVNCNDSVFNDEALAQNWAGFDGEYDDSLPEATPIEQGESDSGTAPAPQPGGELDHAEAGSPGTPGNVPTDGHENEGGDPDQPPPPTITDEGELDKPHEPSTGEPTAKQF